MSDMLKWKYRPYSINIETVQGCNRRCYFCGTMGMEKVLHFVELSQVEHTFKLLRKANFKGSIRFAAHGEPTLHPKIAQIVNLARKALPRVALNLFTNGTVIEKKPSLVDDLFNAGLNNLIVDEYTDHLVGKFIESDPTCKKYQIVREKAGVELITKDPRKKRICIVPPIEGGTKNDAKRKLCNQCGAALPPLKEPMKARCSVVFRELTIRWNGEVAMCCNDFRGLYRVGNIMECSDLEQIWFHHRFEAARRILFTGNRNFFPCNICDVKPNRPGLLPSMGKKVEMEPIRSGDWEIVNRRYEPLAVIEKREWEV
jgi:MoaA/NifB/PqqE/SkfB family radical SAM enzyme